MRFSVHVIDALKPFFSYYLRPLSIVAAIDRDITNINLFGFRRGIAFTRLRTRHRSFADRASFLGQHASRPLPSVGPVVSLLRGGGFLMVVVAD